MLQQPATEFQIFLKVLGYFRTHWWLFLLEVVCVYALSMHNYYSTPSVYESDASILIDNSRRQMYTTFMMPQFGANTLARKQNLVHLLTSEEVLERLRNSLTDFYNSEGRPAHLKHLFPGNDVVRTFTVRTMISIDWDRMSDIYTVHCRAGNSEAAHDVCVAYMNTIQVYYPEVGQRDSMMKRDFLSRQITSLTRQIAEREKNLIEFQKKNPEFMSFVTVDIEEKGRARLRGSINALREEAAANRAMKQLLLKTPNAKRGEQTQLQVPILALTNRISELKYQITLTENSENPDREERLKVLHGELDRTSTQLAQLNDEEAEAYIRNPLAASAVRDSVMKLEIDYRTAYIKLATLERQLEAANRREKQFQGEKLEYDRLRAELEHRRKILMSLYSKEQQTELELSAGTAEVFRVHEPTLTPKRVSPLLAKHLYGSLSFCVFLCAITSMLLIAFFPRLDSEMEGSRLNLPVIGKIPEMRRTASHFEEIPPFALEYLKIMNYRILRETKDVKCPVIVITSAHAREGKSTAAQLLCLASAAPNRRALLIDGDLLTARPNKFFGIHESHTPGLHAILTRTDNPTLDILTVPTATEGLEFMPRGERMEPSPSPDFIKPIARRFDELRSQYDMIFIDTPPLFASNLAHQWAGLADLVVVVARLYVTRPKDITEALQTCKVFSKAPLGVALNCIPLTGHDRKISHYYFSRRKPKPTRLAA